MPLKILVIRFSSLGDVILTTPVYRNLKEAFPDSKVFCAVKAEYTGVLEGNPHIDGILALGKYESLLRFLLRVRAERFDVVIDLHDNLRSAFIRTFSGASQSLKVRKNALERRLFVRRKVRTAPLKLHNIDRYVEAIRPLAPRARVGPPEIFPNARPGRSLSILVIQTAFLGDAVLTTPIFKALKSAIPGCKITLLCTPQIRDVFSGNAHLDEILVMDKKGKDASVFAVFKWGRMLKGKFDVALIPHRSFRSALIAWLAGVPRRIGFESSQGRLLLTDAVPFDWKMHDAERNMRLLEALGISGMETDLDVGKAPENLETRLEGLGLATGRAWVGINPGSVWATKRWLPKGFAQVADRLIQETHCQVLLFGGEKDRPAVDAVSAAMKEKPVNLCGKTDLKTLAGLIARCRLFVTNDSGPMHLASAAHVPVVAIFGPTTRELGFFPYGKDNTIVEVDLPCRPCTLHGGDTCPLGHFRCMNEVDPETVLKACRRYL